MTNTGQIAQPSSAILLQSVTQCQHLLESIMKTTPHAQNKGGKAISMILLFAALMANDLNTCDNPLL